MHMEGYPKLIKWEVFNFMAIEHGVCEFDDTNIILLKGYNDSGKSAMLRALDVLFYNKYAQSQVKFIQDDKDYFRVVAYFEDNVIILRDKYINGQSLYEMYKDGTCIFSTKVNNTLTKVSEVPEPVALYLGVLPELNTRTCYDKQFAVQTSGSENYKAFSTILKSEELAKAGELVNNDKNRLGSDIVSIENKISAYKEVVADGSKLNNELLTMLEHTDKFIDFHDVLIGYLSNIHTFKEQLKNTVIYPDITEVSLSELDVLLGITSKLSTVRSIKEVPEIQGIDDSELTSLLSIVNTKKQLGGIGLQPKITEVEHGELDMLLRLHTLLEQYKNIDADYNEVQEVRTDDLVLLSSIKDLIDKIPDVSSTDSEIERVQNEINQLALQLGDEVSICPDCGHVLIGDEGHVHRG